MKNENFKSKKNHVFMNSLKSSPLIKFKSSKNWGTYIAVLLSLSTLAKSVSNFTDLVGTLSIFWILSHCTLLGVAYFLKKDSLPKILIPLLFSSILLSVIYIIGLLQRSNLEDYKNIGLIILSLNYLFMMSLTSWKLNAIKVLSFFAQLFIFINIVFLITDNSLATRSVFFSGYLKNPNALASIAFLFIFFYLLAIKLTTKKAKIWWLFPCIGSILLIYLSKSRGVWVASLATLATYLLWPFLSSRKFFFKIYILAVFISLFLIIYITTILLDLPNLDYYNDLTLEYTGEHLSSGREDIWSLIFDLVKEKPIWGYSPGARPSEFFHLNVSAHNYYLQILLQVGFVGLSALLMLFWQIWNLYWKSRFSPTTRLSASFFIGILVHQNFEVSLTQNNMALGLLAWTIIGIGISKTIQLNYKSSLNKEKLP